MSYTDSPPWLISGGGGGGGGGGEVTTRVYTLALASSEGEATVWRQGKARYLQGTITTQLDATGIDSVALVTLDPDDTPPFVQIFGGENTIAVCCATGSFGANLDSDQLMVKINRGASDEAILTLYLSPEAQKTLQNEIYFSASWIVP